MVGPSLESEARLRSLERAVVAMQNGDAVTCAQEARSVLLVDGENADAWHLLALSAKKRRAFVEAEQAFARAIQSAGAEMNTSILFANLGNCREEAGDLVGAETAFRAALRRQPDSFGACIGLGNLLLRRGELSAAAEFLDQALNQQPNNPITLNSMGTLCQKQGRLSQAMAYYRQALAVDNTLAVAHYNLAGLLNDDHDHAGAIAHLQQALVLRPNDLDAATSLLRIHQSLCDWPQIATLAERVRTLARQPDAGAVFPFAFLALSEDPAEQLLMARQWSASQYRLFMERGVELAFQPPTDLAKGRLRIGYLSADLRLHATSHLIVELFELHDRHHFELYGYSVFPGDGSALRARVAAAFDHFVEAESLSPEALAHRIHADGIHILVDLNGYTQHTRSSVLALRPAPIQVNFLGFAGSMGAPFVDYILVDPVVAPLTEAGHFDEKLAFLPDCYQPNDRQRARTPARSREACGLPAHGVVFCCFNHTYKITQEIFALWLRLLKSVPESVLWLLSSTEQTMANLRQEAVGCGVAADRLVFAPRVPIEEHMGRLSHADLFLDTRPYNGHTTASDALWVGVPVITCPGATFPSRVAASLLGAVGMTELVAPTLDAYFTLAHDLALDMERRAALKARLLQTTPPLFDTPRFARNLEALYQQMWQRQVAGLPPDHLFLPTGASPTISTPESPSMNSEHSISPHPYTELLIGCGSSRSKRLVINGLQEWHHVTTLDINADHRPDVVWDLTQLPLPFADNSFNEIHAYEVLEHTGHQGDYKFFFAQFNEFWRILKPNGVLIATVPSVTSVWVWGDPSHTRVIPKETLFFLDQTNYTAQIGVTAMSDFRYIYKSDFQSIHLDDNGTTFSWVIRAIKPSRMTPPVPITVKP